MNRIALTIAATLLATPALAEQRPFTERAETIPVSVEGCDAVEARLPAFPDSIDGAVCSADAMRMAWKTEDTRYARLSLQDGSWRFAGFEKGSEAKLVLGDDELAAAVFVVQSESSSPSVWSDLVVLVSDKLLSIQRAQQQTSDSNLEEEDAKKAYMVALEQQVAALEAELKAERGYAEQLQQRIAELEAQLN